MRALEVLEVVESVGRKKGRRREKGRREKGRRDKVYLKRPGHYREHECCWKCYANQSPDQPRLLSPFNFREEGEKKEGEKKEGETLLYKVH